MRDLTPFSAFGPANETHFLVLNRVSSTSWDYIEGGSEPLAIIRQGAVPYEDPAIVQELRAFFNGWSPGFSTMLRDKPYITQDILWRINTCAL